MADPEIEEPGDDPRRPLISIPGMDPQEPTRVPARWATIASWHYKHPDEKVEGGVCNHHEEMCIGLHDTPEAAKKQLDRIGEYRNIRGLQLFSGGFVMAVPKRPLDPSDLQFERLTESPT